MFKLVTIGDNNVDTYESGISYPGGNCPNVAAYAAMNGYPSAYIGVVGKDEFGRIHKAGMEGVGINTSHLRIEDGITSHDIIVSKDGDRMFTCYDRSIIDAYPIVLCSDDINFIKGFDLIHTSIYSAFGAGEFDKLVSLGIPVSFDFSVEWDPSLLSNSTEEYLDELKPVNTDFLKDTCSRIDFAFLSCSHISADQTIETLKRCVGYGCKIAVGTRGMDGSYAFDGTELYHQHAYKTSVVDTLGAGDSFITRFLLTYMDGLLLLSQCEEAVKGSSYSENDKRDFLSVLMRCALSQAALFAARSCQLEGAFGFGQRLS